jgi:aminoglycoside 3-N-acetyltransferase
MRRFLPLFIKKYYRSLRRKRRRNDLVKQQRLGKGATRKALVLQLKQMGICQGDTLMVHSSLGKMGFVEGGAATVIDALKEAVGEKGNLLMPSSPVMALQYDYALKEKVFDVLETPSAMGAITEYFRQQTGVLRSAHPTEPVCAFGPDAEYLTCGHFAEITPYTHRSPWQRMYEFKGKILYVGVTLINAGTHLHTLEDSVEFPYPVYASRVFEFTIRDVDGKEHKVNTRVHNPEWSAKRRCDELIPLFMDAGVCKKVVFGQAPSLLFDATGMFNVMKDLYYRKGVTMYHPQGQ